MEEKEKDSKQPLIGFTLLVLFILLFYYLFFYIDISYNSQLFNFLKGVRLSDFLGPK